MNNKRKWIIRACALLVILVIAAVMFVVGRGHTVYIDNKTLEYSGETYEALFEMNLINTVNKGDDPTETTVKISLPYSWDGIVVNIPGYLAGLPQEAWMTQFVSEPEPVSEEDEEPGALEDEIPMGDI